MSTRTPTDYSLAAFGLKVPLFIVQDTREQLPWAFDGLPASVRVGTLPVGDYSLLGLEHRVAVERKSLDDLVGSLTTGRDRFERELVRGRGYFAFAVVVEAGFDDLMTGRYRSKAKPHALAQSVLAFTARYGVPFIWAGNRSLAEYAAFSFLEKSGRELSVAPPVANPANTTLLSRPDPDELVLDRGHVQRLASRTPERAQ